MRTRHKALLSCIALSAALCVAAGTANAQGKSHGKEQRAASEKRTTSEKRVVARAEERRGHEHGKPKHAKHAKRKVVTTDRAIIVTREVLVKHGYEVVRVETVRGARVVYYRRGNMGRGRGKGPIVRMVIRPVEERVVFESAPRGLLAEINVRLGM